jgi:hypothetical protein
MWLLFGIAFYLTAAICVGLVFRARDQSDQVAYLVAGIASFFFAIHSLLEFVR